MKTSITSADMAVFETFFESGDSEIAKSNAIKLQCEFVINNPDAVVAKKGTYLCKKR